MGLVAMSLKDLQRIEVLTEVLAGRRTVSSAAAVLAISDRQVNRLIVRYRDGGGGALIHQARGRASNNHLDAGVREYACAGVGAQELSGLRPDAGHRGLAGATRDQGGPGDRP